MIRFATYSDIPRIMEFIGRYWKKDHIMSRDRELFEFQHLWGNEVSFLLSENAGEIDGILGYIPYGRSNRDIMLAIWKALKTADVMLGIKLLEFLRKHPSIRTISAPGINPQTRPIYQFLGIETGCMKQWYRLRRMKTYTIARVMDYEIPMYLKERNVQIREYKEIKDLMINFKVEECLDRKNHPIKTLAYIEQRYFCHPIYHYLKYAVQYKEKKLLIILRLQTYNGARILRIVDGIGDEELFRYFTCKLDELLEEYACEYADMYETGIQEEVLIAAGWKPTADTGNIMPEYFSPFEQKNVDIYYMSEISGVVLFKGDGDMDRPNERGYRCEATGISV